MILLTPGKVFYGHEDNIYEITSVLAARYSWNKYSIKTEHVWNEYNVETTPAEDRHSGVGMMVDTADGETFTHLPDDFRPVNHAIFTSKPSYVLTMYNNKPVFSLSTSPTRTYDIFDDSMRISGYSNSDGTYTVTSIEGYTDFWSTDYIDDENKYSTRLYHFQLPDAGAFQYGTDGRWLYFSSDSGEYFNAVKKEGAGTLRREVTSTSSGTYPSNGKSGSYWYISQGSRQTTGDFIETVESNIETAYPNNGAQDGYWYVKV